MHKALHQALGTQGDPSGTQDQDTGPASNEYPSQKRLDDKNDGLGATIGGACGWGTFWVVSGDLLAENEPGWGRPGVERSWAGRPPGDLEPWWGLWILFQGHWEATGESGANEGSSQWGLVGQI